METPKYSEKELDLKLKEQHRNTRHDAIDMVTEYLSGMVSDGLLNTITRDIQNLKQRKP